VVGLKFGKFGREDANLIMTTRSEFHFFWRQSNLMIFKILMIHELLKMAV
jgi:hypothetical protein